MRPDLNHHVPEEILDELAMEMLSEQDSEFWGEHLLVCEACQDRLAETDEFIAATKAAAKSIRSGRGLAKPVAVASHA
jgi:hypothetical protein